MESGAGHWEFPGGKVELGESQTQALCREITEELQLELDPSKLKFIANNVHRYSAKDIQLFLYFYDVPGENISFVLSDHDQFRWVTLEQLDQIAFSPADQILLPAVIKFVQFS
jgi:8-oxo-dGTP diphosphatase